MGESVYFWRELRRLASPRSTAISRFDRPVATDGSSSPSPSVSRPLVPAAACSMRATSGQAGLEPARVRHWNGDA
jgi:hypothetical protein